MLEIHLLGTGQIRSRGRKTVNVRARKEMAALAYLLLEGAQTHSRDVLQALFWQDFDGERARNNLRVVLAHLQALLPGEKNQERLLQTTRTDVQLSLNAEVWVDALEFQRQIEQTQRHEHTGRHNCEQCHESLRKAVALYEAEFLAGFALADCPAFEEWLFLQRERHHLAATKAYHDLVTFATQQGELEQALALVQKLIALDPLREAAYRQQMYILARQGERSQALALFERCRTVIRNELGLDLEPETLSLHQQLLSDQILPQQISTNGAHSISGDAPIPLGHAPFALSHARTESASTNHNLPQQLTSFVGREQELAQLQERLVTASSRLLSLVGPGGIGKTRLSIEVANLNQHLFPDGIFFIALAGVQEVGALPAAVLAAMNVTLLLGAASPAEQLLHCLAPLKTLLIIDNFEHLIDGVDFLLEILRSAPSVTLLVTTREQLNCQAEDLFLLNGLSTPDHKSGIETKVTGINEMDVSQYAAIRLFCERAYRLHKNFKLTPENSKDVVKICQLVEGMPLAIELATTWLADYDCAALAAAVAQNLSLLATTQRDLPYRHRSMQAVFDYSWQMLSVREQRILSQLALCQGRFSAHIANRLTEASLIDLMGLRYKSLLRSAEAAYYDLHPLIRSFAEATLDPATRTSAEERLATLYLQQVAEQSPALDGASPQAALQMIGQELDNVHQVWQWAVDQQRTDLLVQAATGLGGYYAATGRNLECELRFLPLAQQLIDPLESVSDLNRLLCVRLLDKVCHSLVWLGKLAEANQWAQKMVDVAQAIPNLEYAARGLVHWGKALDEQTNPAEAVRKYQSALTWTRQLGLLPLTGLILIEMSHPLRDLGKGSEADEVLSESLVIQRSQGNRLAEQRALLYLSVGRREEGDFQADRNYLMEALDLLKLTANRHVETRLLDALGINYGLVGNYAAALEYHQASRRIAHEIHQPVQECHTLRHMCTAHRKLGNLESAKETGLESLRLALENKLPSDTAHARLYLGYVWLAAGRLDDAAREFQLAYDSWQAQEYINLSQEAWVGLATVDLRNGNAPRAAERIAPIVPTLSEHVLVGVREPYEMQLACYDILTAIGDERAPALLATAYQQLQTNVNKVTDKSLLRCFWDAPVHNRIRQLWHEILEQAKLVWIG